LNPEALRRRLMMVGYVLGLIALLAVAINVLHHVRVAASILAISILLAYVIAPLVNFLSRPIFLVIPTHVVWPRTRQPIFRLSSRRRVYVVLRRGLPRVLAICVVYAFLGLLLVVAGAIVVPLVQKEFLALMSNLGGMVDNLEEQLQKWAQWLGAHLPASLGVQLDPTQFSLDRLVDQMQVELPRIMSGTFTGVKAVASLVVEAFLIPLITFYILMDSETYRSGFLRLIPAHRKAGTQRILMRIDETLGRYIRGQLIVCLTVGLQIGIALNLLGVQYALLIAVFAGVIDIIPYVGVLIGYIPAFLIALAHKGFLFALLVIAVLACIHWLEGHVVAPAVVGHQVGLPPLTVMVALLAGAELGGIMGMVVAIPLAAIGRVLLDEYARSLEESQAPLPEPENGGLREEQEARAG
jgi:predicted PurR-regulated permease PerM